MMTGCSELRTLARCYSLLLCFAGLLHAADSLEIVVAAARAPAAPPIARTRLAEFAKKQVPLAQFALGLVEYEHGDYAGAVRDLADLAPKLPKLADYVQFYLGSAHAHLEDSSGAAAALGNQVWTEVGHSTINNPHSVSNVGANAC